MTLILLSPEEALEAVCVCGEPLGRVTSPIRCPNCGQWYAPEAMAFWAGRRPKADYALLHEENPPPFSA